ncbi:MAG: CHASE2 domain-containing protein [Microcoleus sp. PH2017_10_PVI_O_A]|uniref:CHASE2 domain-containing protein n=1 Tax=unclassified Microcoleus TaxID=2642155 RepID=UPI001D466C2B|nr:MULTISPECIES: CHASE2 domain-containing protein [unclassified Microcoleus]TAE77266.1 MAG: CHASE2 domain-containing protein [Oscillatoriales cyanobacterium]MCC3409116.1 CHASE2 domain-containing protein [Microcoleus sp. PH2017_10_PVI_O_A]MCC3463252.1 CHASE2 domain-containing protein [Microcoleus sp. PH2017_11_PCY_U_A]MCC3481673.1 CHASE2 domain-containing protein [Microcoleus sp. PH2017_12_PCY_D_A]MCC3531603.1 CHASE2 domain-containing protein [Microcoleus sp. PH2017_21_RUC_O_A]
MSKLVYLKLDGDLRNQGFRVTLQIIEDGGEAADDLTKSLPANPALADLIETHWNQKYRSLGTASRHQRKIVFPSKYSLVKSYNKKTFPSRKISWRVKIKQVEIRSSLKRCQESGEEVAAAMNAWLNSEEFREIDKRLSVRLNVDEDIRVLIRTEDPNLHKLPWELWDLFKIFPKAEPSLSQLNFGNTNQFQKPVRKSKVRILAILGNSHDINVQEDRKTLEEISPNHAEVIVLVEPDIKQITDDLWEQHWDIIFFAGHGQTENGTGKIYINKNDSLTIDELWIGLRKAVDNGLQLAIFNCCDGLGLATKLDDFQRIPQMILMRELVPDYIAQEFLKYFLTEFVAGKSLYAAKKEARLRLQVLENEFPCASWLPVIWQHPAAKPAVWNDFLLPPDSPAAAENLTAASSAPKRPQVKGFSRFKSVILASAGCTLAVMGARFLGVMEPLELSMLDRLMSQREPELIDNRLLVVEVTNKDAEKYGYPQNDATLAKAIDKLQQFQPLIIGLNMHRNSAREPGRKQLISLFDSHPNIITVCSYGSTDKNFDPPPELSQAKLTNQLGFSDLTPDELRHEKGSSIRRQSLSYEPNLSSFTNNCKISKSFSFFLALRFLENQGIKSQITNNQEWRIGDVTFKRLASRTGGYQDLNAPVSQILLNYRANPKPAFKVTLQEVLEGKINSDLVKDKIVLIGHTSQASRDESDTPYGKMPGVWIHAHMVSQILSAVIDKRPLLWVLPQFQGFQWGDAVFVWLVAVTGGLLAWRARSLLVLAIASGGMIFVLYQGSLVILTFGGWMPLVPAVLALVATGGILFVYDRS